MRTLMTTRTALAAMLSVVGVLAGGSLLYVLHAGGRRDKRKTTDELRAIMPEVTHLDSSKVAIEWAKKNAELSGLSRMPIRYIEDDALKFLRREVKRQNKYDAIIMDPPAFGHGSGAALWKIERDFYELFALVEQVLSENPLALIVNGYTNAHF